MSPATSLRWSARYTPNAAQATIGWRRLLCLAAALTCGFVEPLPRTTDAAGGGRALVLVKRAGATPEFAPSRLLLLNLETGQRLADVAAGFHPQIGVSSNGQYVAVVSDPRGQGNRRWRMTVYDTKDLTKVKDGFLPSRDLLSYTVIPPFPNLAFSSDNSRVFMLHRHGRATAEGREVEIIHVSSVLWQAPLDEDYGELKVDGSVTLTSARCGYPRIVSADGYPRVCVYCPGGCSLDIVDFEATKVVQRLVVSDNTDVSIRPNAPQAPPGYPGGAVIARESDAYVIPIVGFVRKIGLKGSQAFISLKGKAQYDQPDLNSLAACASEEELCIGKKYPENGSNFSRQIFVLSTRDLTVQRTIRCSIPFNYLEVSKDGRYLYALKWTQGNDAEQLAVIESATGKQVNVLGNLGIMPSLVIALPD